METPHLGEWIKAKKRNRLARVPTRDDDHARVAVPDELLQNLRDPRIGKCLIAFLMKWCQRSVVVEQQQRSRRLRHRFQKLLDMKLRVWFEHLFLSLPRVWITLRRRSHEVSRADLPTHPAGPHRVP